MPNLFDPPSIFALPLSKGRDLVFSIHNKSGDDWPSTTSMSVQIDASPVIDVAATRDGAYFRFKVESETIDPIPARTPWRLRLTDTSTTPAYNDVPVNGETVRSDGGRF